MSITHDELISFHQFATQVVGAGQADVSIEELVRQWRTARERVETNASIRQSLSEIESGYARPVDDFLDDMIAKHNLSLES